MPELRPFRGLRYTERAGSPADLVAPPYDVIGPAEHAALCRRSPYNVVRLILGERHAADEDPGDWYDAAAERLRAWCRDGILAMDERPALYLYTQAFHCEGGFRRRKLLLGALKLEPYETGSILPHENTTPGPKADRLRLMRTTRANLSPILAFFPDDDGRVNERLEAALAMPSASTFTDHVGVEHQLRCLFDPATCATLTDALRPRHLYIADGHHRYETALAYQRLQRSSPSVGAAAELPCDFLLAACMSGADPGMVIRPTHRLVRWADGPTFEDLLQRAREWFDVERMAVAEASGVPAALSEPENVAQFAVYGGAATGFVRLALRVREAMADSPHPPTSSLRSLPAAVFGHVVVTRLLGEHKPTVSYTADADEAVERVDGRVDRLAGLLPPVRPVQLMTVVHDGERMPPKSTYFWPKALTGIVMRSLEES